MATVPSCTRRSGRTGWADGWQRIGDGFSVRTGELADTMTSEGTCVRFAERAKHDRRSIASAFSNIRLQPPDGAVTVAAHITSHRCAPRYGRGVTRTPCERAAPERRKLSNTKPTLTKKRREILEFIRDEQERNGFPPSMREIGEAVGLTSSSTVHSHLATLQKQGFLRRHPTKPRAMEICWDSNSDSVLERRPARHVPLVGNVAAGTDVLAQENLEELLPLPEDFTGDGQLFMLRVRGDSMIGAGIFSGDFVVVRQQPVASNGDIVVAGIPGEEATIKTYRSEGATVVLTPHNPALEPMVFPADEVTIYGKVVTVLRKL